MQTPLQLLPGSTLFSFNRRHAPPPSPSARPEPIREIRFEDSPPEAVRAVVRYIYLGQKPILEPYCGYTVKDLMALASYLEIPPLEDYCVQLVLGTHRDSTFADDDDHDIHYNTNVINNNHMVLLQTNQPKSRISPEMAVQVLFDWGYKYTKIRSALVCALIESGSSAADEDVLYDPEVGLMRAFEDHRAFSAVLCEMTERRLSQRLV
ncbi:hypothetical protein BGX29_008628 [Mortierella sp. GBA35]|nr:hypothetical protein BGX29_008628 [Mortierella sp. GBA35]